MFKFLKRRRAAPSPQPDAPAADGARGPEAEAGAPADPPAQARPDHPAAAGPAPEPESIPPGAPPSGAPPSDDPPGTPPGAPPGAPPPGAAPPGAAPPPRGLAPDEIARGMQHAAAAANQLLAHQYTTVLDQFFDAAEDGLLTPRTVDVALDAEHTMPVPLVALATPRGLALDRMIVHLTVRGDFTEALPAGGFAGDDQRGRFYVTLAPPSARGDAQGPAQGRANARDSQHIDIEMQFAALAPPEAIMRVIDEYTHRLVPRARHEGEEPNHA